MLIDLLIQLLILAVVVWVVCYIIDLLPLPDPPKLIVKLVIGLIALIYILKMALPALGVKI